MRQCQGIHGGLDLDLDTTKGRFQIGKRPRFPFALSVTWPPCFKSTPAGVLKFPSDPSRKKSREIRPRPENPGGRWCRADVPKVIEEIMKYISINAQRPPLSPPLAKYPPASQI
jgi:hypothetical protein